MRLIKLIGAANRQSPVIARRYLSLCHRNTRLGCVLTNALIKHYRLHSTDPDLRLHFLWQYGDDVISPYKTWFDPRNKSEDLLKQSLMTGNYDGCCHSNL